MTELQHKRTVRTLIIGVGFVIIGIILMFILKGKSWDFTGLRATLDRVFASAAPKTSSTAVCAAIFNGFGFSLIAASYARLKKAKKDPSAFKKDVIEQNDERNQMIFGRAMRSVVVIAYFIGLLSIIALWLLQYIFAATVIAANMVLDFLIYSIFKAYYKKKL
ncbi:MAG: hypothetical protein LBN00_10605 [Oscillospiraceae bacterium]|jgi:hypothetical protein|nr:hypothetical protein [Oscillospiraceae bacterium]